MIFHQLIGGPADALGPNRVQGGIFDGFAHNVEASRFRDVTAHAIGGVAGINPIEAARR